MDQVAVPVQKYDLFVQDYTIEFHEQAISSKIPIDDDALFMKYVGVLHESIRKELKLFKVEDISRASVQAMEIKEKNRSRERKKGNKFRKKWRKLR